MYHNAVVPFAEGKNLANPFRIRHETRNLDWCSLKSRIVAVCQQCCESCSNFGRDLMLVIALYSTNMPSTSITLWYPFRALPPRRLIDSRRVDLRVLGFSALQAQAAPCAKIKP